MAFAEDYRQVWIAETLHVFGFINREHIQRKFGLSAPQVSKDLNKFLRENPGEMTYNTSAKRYEAIAGPTPYIAFRMRRGSE